MESLNEKILTACRTELCGLYPGLNGAFALLPQKDGRILGTDGRTLFVPPDLTQMYAENPARFGGAICICCSTACFCTSACRTG